MICQGHIAQVYAIQNKVSHTVYVGSVLKRLDKRWGRHLSQLRRGEHDNRLLQKEWNQYGEASFELVVLEIVPVDSELKQCETKWIKHYRALGRLYNFRNASSNINRRKGNMPVTVKINDEANALLEVYLGWKRAQEVGRDSIRLNKEDVASESVKSFVIANMPAALIKSLFKSADSKA